jgi:hypothetical protein
MQSTYEIGTNLAVISPRDWLEVHPVLRIFSVIA